MIILSFTGTLRTIVVLVLIWMLLRWLLRRSSGRPPGTRRVPPDGRPPGDVRIEHSDNIANYGHVQDADYEEIR
ncbi:MAG: hypothetical protein JNM31_14385 [Flavobacteriales bacterium]|nr:hypothetical protein [Flavobacteriales bacterium]